MVAKHPLLLVAARGLALRLADAAPNLAISAIRPLSPLQLQLTHHPLDATIVIFVKPLALREGAAVLPLGKEDAAGLLEATEAIHPLEEALLPREEIYVTTETGIITARPEELLLRWTQGTCITTVMAMSTTIFEALALPLSTKRDTSHSVRCPFPVKSRNYSPHFPMPVHVQHNCFLFNISLQSCHSQ